MRGDTIEGGVTAGTASEIAGGAPARAAEIDRPRASDLLRALMMAVGIGWSAAFVVVGVAFDLHLFGDGSLFSYAVAVEDGWAIHWHNISGRAFSYLYAFLPAEAWIALTDAAAAGVGLYGLLHFAAPSLSLLATAVADRSRGHAVFGLACLSTACLGPLVFGFPTEMRMAHALFWPTLAAVLYAPAGAAGRIGVVVGFLALVFTHEGAVVLAAAIVGVLSLCAGRDRRVPRAAGALAGALAVWVAVKAVLRPDPYVSGILEHAALQFIDLSNLTRPVMLVLIAAFVTYGLATHGLRRMGPARATVWATAGVAAMLVAYWTWFDHSLHAGDRYPVRTALLVATPLFGFFAVARALDDERRLALPTWLANLLRGLWASERAVWTVGGAIVLVMLVHAVETAKFLDAWTGYQNTVRTLAQGSTSDPALGDSEFVSARRIAAKYEPLAWNSTTPYLAVMLAPGFAPARLVVDPEAGYFWLSCATALANEEAAHAVPVATRTLVRRLACLYH